jgi:predicted RNase H-like nuclease (RuvC/YqgF family)
MAENAIPQAEDQTTQDGQEASAVQKTDYEKQNAELTEKVKELENRFNGVQSVLSKTQNEKEELEKKAEQERLEKMSDLEKVQHELAIEREERQKWQREVRIKDNIAKAKDFLRENDLPDSMLDIMKVDDDESLKSSLEKAAHIAQEMQGKISKSFAEKYGQPAPKTGNSNGELVPPKSLAEAKTKEEKIAYLKAKRMEK